MLSLLTYATTETKFSHFSYEKNRLKSWVESYFGRYLRVVVVRREKILEISESIV